MVNTNQATSKPNPWGQRFSDRSRAKSGRWGWRSSSCATCAHYL